MDYKELFFSLIEQFIYPKSSSNLIDSEEVIMFANSLDDEQDILRLFRTGVDFSEHIKEEFSTNRELVKKILDEGCACCFSHFIDDRELALIMFRRCNYYFEDSDFNEDINFCRELLDGAKDAKERFTVAVNIKDSSPFGILKNMGSELSEIYKQKGLVYFVPEQWD